MKPYLLADKGEHKEILGRHQTTDFLTFRPSYSILLVNLNNIQQKPVIGIVGGIGSGKSIVAYQLCRRGGQVIDADHLGHKALLRDDVIRAATKRWGHGVVQPDGNIDRKKLADVVFGSNSQSHTERLFLESLIHPHIKDTISQKHKAAQSNPAVSFVVLDAALLFEANWDSLCDYIIFVDTPEPLRIQRTIEARGWSKTEVTKRETSQESLINKRQLADFVLDNSGPLEKTFQKTEEILRLIPDIPLLREDLSFS